MRTGALPHVAAEDHQVSPDRCLFIQHNVPSKGDHIPLDRGLRPDASEERYDVSMDFPVRFDRTEEADHIADCFTVIDHNAMAEADAVIAILGLRNPAPKHCRCQHQRKNNCCLLETPEDPAEYPHRYPHLLVRDSLGKVPADVAQFDERHW